VRVADSSGKRRYRDDGACGRLPRVRDENEGFPFCPLPDCDVFTLETAESA
jgi:hypothetical protein